MTCEKCKYFYITKKNGIELETGLCNYPLSKLNIPEGYQITHKCIPIWIDIKCDFYNEKDGNKILNDKKIIDLKDDIMTLKEKYEQEKSEIESTVKFLIDFQDNVNIMTYISSISINMNYRGADSVYKSIIEFLKENTSKIMTRAAEIEFQKIGE